MRFNDRDYGRWTGQPKTVQAVVRTAPRPDPQVGQQASARHNVYEVNSGQREVPHVEGLGSRSDAVGELVEMQGALDGQLVQCGASPSTHRPKRLSSKEWS